MVIVCICAVILIAGLVIAMLADRSPFEPETTEATTTAAGDTQTESRETEAIQNNSTEAATYPTEEPATRPVDQPSNVQIPTETDPATGESLGIQFPCHVPGYDLVLEKLASYSGMYVEDGSNASVTNVAMLMVRNDGHFPLEYTQIQIRYETETLVFDITALPVGERLVVQEKTGKPIPAGDPVESSAMVVQRANMEMSLSQVKVTDVGNNSLQIENLTDRTIQTVRVFYKYYMEEENVFVGGIAYTVRISRLAPNATMTIQPAHYNSTTSRVVMVLSYDEEA